jgi:hypothetical protein
MAKWHHPDSEYSEISKEYFEVREAIIAALKVYMKDISTDYYPGPNLGISEDDFDDAAEGIMAKFDISPKKQSTI